MKHEKIDYVEFPSQDLGKTQEFFKQVFCWDFTAYGSDYIAFSNEGLDGGFFKSDKISSTESGSALIIFYSQELEQTQAKIKSAGGKIVKPVFSFPGGRRFHFSDPNGNEYAVWTKAS